MLCFTRRTILFFFSSSSNHLLNNLVGSCLACGNVRRIVPNRILNEKLSDVSRAWSPSDSLFIMPLVFNSWLDLYFSFNRKTKIETICKLSGDFVVTSLPFMLLFLNRLNWVVWVRGTTHCFLNVSNCCILIFQIPLIILFFPSSPLLYSCD